MRSGQLLQLFMEKAGDVEGWKDDLTPETLMLAAIKDKGHYNEWPVED